jgi:hypothetical protein
MRFLAPLPLYLLATLLAATHGTEPLIWLDDETLKLELPTSRFHYALKFDRKFCVALVSREAPSPTAADQKETQTHTADKVLVVVPWLTCLREARGGGLMIMVLQNSKTAHVDALYKDKLYATATAAYGSWIAGQLTPISFTLPDETTKFVTHLEKQAKPEDIFVLKYSRIHRGKGLAFVNRSESLRVASMEVPRVDTIGSSRDPRNTLVAQHFVNNTYRFVPDRVASTRIWVQLCWSPYVSGVNRAYLFPGASMDFGNPLPGDLHKASAEELHTAFNANQYNADVATALNSWTLEDMRSHFLAKTGNLHAFQAVWDRLKQSIAAALAAAIPKSRKFKQRTGSYHGGSFVYPDLGAVLGFDIVFRDDLQPIIIEVNAIPGMAPNAMNCSVPGYSHHPSGVPCEPHQVFGDKLAFIRAYFGLYDDLKHKVDALALERQAYDVVKASSCNITVELLHEIVLSDMERSFALSRGFEDLSGLLYSSLRCMASGTEACTSIFSPLVSHSLSEKQEHFAAENEDSGSSRIKPVNSNSVVEMPLGAISSRTLSMQTIPLDASTSNDGSKYQYYQPKWHDALVHAWHQQRGQRESFDETSVDAALDRLCALQREIRLLKDHKEVQTRDEL